MPSRPVKRFSDAISLLGMRLRNRVSCIENVVSTALAGSWGQEPESVAVSHNRRLIVLNQNLSFSVMLT